MTDTDLVFDDLESSRPGDADLRPIKALLQNEEFVELDDVDEDEDDDSLEEESELESPSILNRIRRSIDGIFGSPSDALDDKAEKHIEKAHRRKGGKGKPKGEKKGKKSKGKGKLPVDAARKHKNAHEERRRKNERKVRNEKKLAALELIQRPGRVRRQHVVPSDDEDLAEASGSGALDTTNRQCEVQWGINYENFLINSFNYSPINLHYWRAMEYAVGESREHRFQGNVPGCCSCSRRRI